VHRCANLASGNGSMPFKTNNRARLQSGSLRLVQWKEPKITERNDDQSTLWIRPDFFFAIFLLLNGCGGDSGGGDDDDAGDDEVSSQSQQGVFIDAPVAGISYETGGEIRITDEGWPVQLRSGC